MRSEGFEILTTAIMKSSGSRNITLHMPLTVKWRFEVRCCFRLQDWTSQKRNHYGSARNWRQTADWFMFLPFLLFSSVIVQPWRWVRCTSPKGRTVSELFGATIQKTANLLVTAERTWNKHSNKYNWDTRWRSDTMYKTEGRGFETRGGE
jgi:hypothetical protein